MRTSVTALLAASLCVPALSAAQQFPTKPVRMVIHIGPGSSMDIVGRVLAQKLNETWAQPVIVDNRAGAGGVIGIDVVAKAPPDGYTIFIECGDPHHDLRAASAVAR